MITLIYKDQVTEAAKNWVQHIAQALDKPMDCRQMEAEDIPVEIDEEVQLLFIACPQTRKTVQAYLNGCRELRVPYTFLTGQLTEEGDVLMPISFLEEEAEKGQYAAAWGRFLGTATTLLKPHDYGHKAERTIRKITALLDRFKLKYTIAAGRKDSFGINKEAAKLADAGIYRLLILSASRDYGLDDLLLGPPERHIVLRSRIPVMLVNPRGDLYSLCD